MVEYDILGSAGQRYCTVAYTPEKGQIHIKNFRTHNLSFVFDAKAVPQMLQALKNIQYIQFGQGVKYD